jgi:hypothetical protein
VKKDSAETGSAEKEYVEMECPETELSVQIKPLV